MTNDDGEDVTTRAAKPTQDELDRADIDDIDAAELEEADDDAEREHRQNRAALIGLVALVLVIVLTGLGIYSVVAQTRGAGTADPDISHQQPAPAPAR